MSKRRVFQKMIVEMIKDKGFLSNKELYTEWEGLGESSNSLNTCLNLKSRPGDIVSYGENCTEIEEGSGCTIEELKSIRKTKYKAEGDRGETGFCFADFSDKHQTNEEYLESKFEFKSEQWGEEFRTNPQSSKDVGGSGSGKDDSDKKTDNQLYADILNRRKNIILEGPPGTGKTHAIKGIVEQLEESIEDGGKGKGKWAITMHPATSYEDFIEGLRPVDASDEKDDEKGDEKSRFIYKPGVFVERVRDAIQNPHQQHVVLLDELNRSNVPRVLGDLLTTLEASKRTKRYNYPEKGENAIVVKPCKAKIMYLEYVDRKKDKLVDLKIKLLDSIDSSVQADYSLGEIRKQVTLISRTRKRAYNSLLKELRDKIDALSTADNSRNRKLFKNLCESRNINYCGSTVDSFRPSSEIFKEGSTFKYVGVNGQKVDELELKQKPKGKKESDRDIGHGKIISKCLVEKDGRKYCAFVNLNGLSHPILSKDVEKLMRCSKNNWESFDIENLTTLDKELNEIEILIMNNGSVQKGSDGQYQKSEFMDIEVGDYYHSQCDGNCIFQSEERYWCDFCDRNWYRDDRVEVTLSGSKKKLHIPENLLVVGTMNTTDRSVAPLDSALRRRFVFLRIDPQTGIFKKKETKYKSLSDDVKEYFEDAEENWISLNTWLETNLGKDATIGHSYLFELIEQLSKANDSIIEAKKYTKQMWQYSILPQVADLLDATGQSHALWDKNPKPAKKVKEYLLGLKLKLKTPDENMNRTFSRTLVVPPDKDDESKQINDKVNNTPSED